MAEAVTTVFPAYVGMFLRGVTSTNLGCSFPRVCGDVPGLKFASEFPEKFSPRMRGCSDPHRVGAPWSLVFPAYAGMFLVSVAVARSPLGFPRVCGDVPSLPKRGSSM